MNETDPLRFYGGTAGALAPFAVFLAGVAWLGLSGAPDERGFWPVLLAALALGLILASDRRVYAETVIAGMSRPIVMLMVMAWILAGVLGAVMNASGFVEALIWVAAQVGVRGAGFVVASFLVAGVVSTATGTSLGTILLCAPLLYPAGGLLGASLALAEHLLAKHDPDGEALAREVLENDDRLCWPAADCRTWTTIASRRSPDPPGVDGARLEAPPRGRTTLTR